jgi:hypothetical protein
MARADRTRDFRARWCWHPQQRLLDTNTVMTANRFDAENSTLPPPCVAESMAGICFGHLPSYANGTSARPLRAFQ